MSTHLYRSRDDRMLAGVAGGLAELWDADPSLVRIVWALLIPLTGGIALVVYIVMAIVVPEEDGSRRWDTQWVGFEPSSGSPAASSAGATGSASTPSSADDPASPPSPPAGSGATPGAWQPSHLEAREMRHEARRAGRAARRARRSQDGRSGAIAVGVLFILVGAWFLVREFLPSIDWDWFWPLVLVGIGVLVLLLAVRPRDEVGSGGVDDGGGT